jgi:UDP-glucose:O-linked fucose beta-1,3-glucosyltransferase
VEKLKAKYETVAAKLQSKDGDLEEKSQAYYIIKAAQEREELQKQGDQLNSDIARKKLEIRGFRKTMELLLQRNQVSRR